MRQGQQNNHHNKQRMRGRNNRKGPNPLTRSYESNGGDVKIRGTALHIAEKYVQLARDAHSSGDRVASENYFQHAEHYYRMVAAAQAQMPQPQPVFRTDGDNDEDEDRADGDNSFGGNQGYQGGDQPNFGMADPQPYVNGNGQGGQADQDMPRQNNGPNDYPQQNRFDNRGGQDNRGDQQNRDQQNRGQDNRGGQENRERGDFRGRRRRPFRDRYHEQGPRADAQQDAGPAPLDVPPGDD